MASRRCKTCGNTKDITDFVKDRSQKGGRRNYCKACHAQKARQFREKNPDWRKSYKPKTKPLTMSYDDRRMWLNSIKAETGCYFCGETTPVCLDFHHIDPTEKSFTISLVMKHSVEEIIEEMQKCAVICANCHRKVHAGLLSL